MLPAKARRKTPLSRNIGTASAWKKYESNSFHSTFSRLTLISVQMALPVAYIINNWVNYYNSTLGIFYYNILINILDISLH